MNKTILTIALLSLGACAQRAPVSNKDVSFAIEQSHTLVKAGESVTFTAHALGVAGRDEEIKWDAKGGELTSLNDMERYARVEYEKPGTYSVVASLYVDGRLVDQERATVQVDPLS